MPVGLRLMSASMMLSTAAFMACADRDPRVASEWRAVYDTVGDTAIVRTVGGSVWGDTAQLVADLTIGQFEGPDEYMFGQIQSLAVAPDGSIYLFDSHVPALRKYAPDGSYLTTFGRAGGGPGEYRMPDAGLAVLPDGRVLLRDPGNTRISVYSPDGEYLDGWRIRGNGTSRPLYKDSLANVYQLIVLDPLDEVTKWRFGLVRYGPDGVPNDTLPFPRWNYETPGVVARSEDRGTTHKYLPFAPRIWYTYSPSAYIVAGLPTHYSFDLFLSPGRVLRIERSNWRPVPVAPAERSEQERIVIATMRRTDPTWRWTGPGIPETKPPYTGLFAGETGRIWVLLHQEARKVELEARRDDAPDAIPQPTWVEPVAFDVFEPDGRYLGTVRAPQGFATRPTPVFRHDTAWAVVHSTLDVPLVRRYVIAH